MPDLYFSENVTQPGNKRKASQPPKAKTPEMQTTQTEETDQHTDTKFKKPKLPTGKPKLPTDSPHV